MRVIVVLLLFAGGCHFREGAYSTHVARKARAEAIAGMRVSTSQQGRGTAVRGEALSALVSGRTHVFRYAQNPLGRPGPYVETTTFAPDGRYVFVDHLLQSDPAGDPRDRWRVEGSRLCILRHSFASSESCFALAVLPDGRVQYFVSEPGSDADGLLTKVTDEVR